LFKEPAQRRGRFQEGEELAVEEPGHFEMRNVPGVGNQRELCAGNGFGNVARELREVGAVFVAAEHQLTLIFGQSLLSVGA